MSRRAWYSWFCLCMFAVAYGAKWIDAPAAGSEAWSSAAAFLALVVFGLAPEKNRK